MKQFDVIPAFGPRPAMCCRAMGLARPVAVIMALVCCCSAAAREPRELLTTPRAEAFGSAPMIWGTKLSPSGTAISSIRAHPSGTTILMHTDLISGESRNLLVGIPEEHDVAWCDWASDEDILCGLRMIVSMSGDQLPMTRLVRVTVATGEARLLMENKLQGEFAQYQDRVLDWMPDDPVHILVQRPMSGGSGVARLNIRTGSLVDQEHERERVYSWLADGHGEARLYRMTLQSRARWYVRDSAGSDWRILHDKDLLDTGDDFSPVGFAEDRNELLYFDRHDGRWALFADQLGSDVEPALVYAHPEYDVSGARSLGKYKRLVAATYIDDRMRSHFFDPAVARVHDHIGEVFPDSLINILDEDWNRRFYLVFVSSAVDPGAYYLFDSRQDEIILIGPAYPSLLDVDLAPMTAISYPAADGTSIPAFLTLPNGHDEPMPAVILPHGGPSSRDYWSYDFLAQYLAASGYAVLQSNYRGSSGYGEAWEGDGGFRAWRTSVGDIRAGVEFLVDQGIADPDRICAVGWSYGGYAALMSVIEYRDTFRCVASIAGVTDPGGMQRYRSRFVGGVAARAFIGDDDDVLEQGAPVERAEEIGVPVLLIHPRQDVNVPISQSNAMARALKSARADHEFIEYEYAEHNIQPERYRIDLLARVGAFLGEQIGGRGQSDRQ